MSMNVRGILLVVSCFVAPLTAAQPMKNAATGEASVALLAPTSVPPLGAMLASALPDSVRLKMLAAVGRGDIAGAISMWQLATGRNTVPPALQALRAAFSLENRVAGPCARVAKAIHQGFKSLGGSPQYLRISSTQGQFLSWRGRTVMSDNNAHFAVMHKDRFYDAFTGPAGMLRAEYLKNILMRGEPLVDPVAEEFLTP